MSTRRYASPQAFRQALDERIRCAIATTGESIERFRQLVVMDRLAARLAVALGERVQFKGAMAILYRHPRARTTQDLDVRALGAAGSLPEELRLAGLLDLGDFLRFLVEPHLRHPEITGPGVVYGGHRSGSPRSSAARSTATPSASTWASGTASSVPRKRSRAGTS